MVAVFHATAEGSLTALVARRAARGIEILDVRTFAGSDTGAAAWADEHLAGRRVAVLPSACVIARAVQMPFAPEDKLTGALALNATTFVLGRTPEYRVATTLVPGEWGTERIRTGLVVEWPTDQVAPRLPEELAQDNRVTFAPEVAGLVVLAGAVGHVLVTIAPGHDPESSTVSVAVPTSRGLLVRVVRAGREQGMVDAQEITRAVGEACVHADVPEAEAMQLVAQAREAAAAALAGGLGCSAGALQDLRALVHGSSHTEEADWWRTHGMAVGTAYTALHPATTALSNMRAVDPGARPGRVAALLNRMASPALAGKLLLAALAIIIAGPLAFQWLRLQVLTWKLPEVEAYERLEQEDRQKRAMYTMLARNSASVTKTLSDIAAAAPNGIEVEFINITQSNRGPAVTIRGKACPTSSAHPGSEVLLDMERLMNASGMFQQITRSSEPPAARGCHDFTISAVAVNPTVIAKYPEEQDYQKKSMRVRNFGPMPEDVDLVAEGLSEADVARTARGASGSAAGNTAAAGTSSPETGGAASETAVTATDPSEEGAANAGSSSRSGTRTTTGRTAGRTGASTPAAPAGRTGTGETGAAEAAGTQVAGGAAPASGSGQGSETEGTASGTTAGGEQPAPSRGTRGGPGGLARRGTGGPDGGSSAEAEPPPPPLTQADVDAMTKAQALDALKVVAQARKRDDLSDEVKERLRAEFDMLLERCKRD